MGDGDHTAVVTGGAGFIGSHLVRELLRCGWHVRVIDDLSAGKLENLPARDEPLPVGRATFSHLDVVADDDRAPVARLCEGAQVVFHLAAQSSVAASVHDPVADATANVLGTINVLDAARAAGARVVFASTGGAIYGECDHPAAEHEATRPASPYGMGKLAAETYVIGWNLLHGQENLVLRYANVYGPLQRSDGEAGVVSIFAHKIAGHESPTVYGDGLQTRDFVYVADVARATVLAAERGLSGVYNVGSGVETSIRDVLLLVRAAAQRLEPPSRFRDPLPAVQFDPRPGDLRRSVVSSDALRAAIGWVPIFGLAEGVGHTYAWASAR